MENELMDKRFAVLTKLALLTLVFSLFGCSKDSSTPLTPTNQTEQPSGTITGLIRNRTTGAPVAGAKISVGYNGSVQSVYSDSAGAFSFADVPAGNYQIVNGAPVYSGSYTLTVSLVNYNAAQTDPQKKYRDWYYSEVPVTFTSLGRSDSGQAAGLAGSVVVDVSYLNTTVKGQVVDQNMAPLAGSVVTLFDATVAPAVPIAQTTTASDGSYQFTGIDDGLSINITAVSRDGSLKGNLPLPITLPGQLNPDSTNAGVEMAPIVEKVVDAASPYVVGITPGNNSDVSPSALQFVYTFSEPIKQTPYTRTDLPVGSHTMIDDIVLNFVGLKKTSGSVDFTAQWNAAFSQLTITPQGLVGSARYTLDLTAAFNSGKITDAAGNPLVNNTNITGDFEPLQFTTSGGSPVPAAPTVTRRFVAGYFSQLDYTGGTVGLEWNYDQNARSYNIYKSIDGGSFQLLQSDFYGIQFTDNSGSLVVPQGAANPLAAGTVSYQVRAVSRDLVEGAASNVITVGDGVAPRLVNATVAASGNNSWTYTLSFSEPLKVSTAESVTSYLFTNTGTVVFTKVSASYVGVSQNGTYIVVLSVTTSATPVAGYTLTVSGVTDVAGNGMDQTAYSHTF